MSLTLSRRALGVLGVAALLSACSTSPLGRNQLAFYSDDELSQMGKQSFSQYEQQLPTVGGAQARYVQCVADHHRPGAGQRRYRQVAGEAVQG